MKIDYTFMYRQGDLLFIRCAPEKVSGELQHSLVVLGSSVTGHEHKLSCGQVYVNGDPSFEHPGNFYIQVPESGADLLHPEHKVIHLPEGAYEVRRQREVNGFVKD